MSKVLLVLSDALRDDVARAQMGYLELLVENRHATRYTVRAELPTLSRTCYEAIHTGVPATVHGITGNYQVRRSVMPSIFSEARKHGKTTGAAAYSWYSELYNRIPFDPIFDREVDDPSLNIQHGRFYLEDDFPDQALYSLGGLLMAKHQPDYLLIHPMGLDTIGHRMGGHSREYANMAVIQDMILATLIPMAIPMGYTVIVTGDHGMSAFHNHNGTLDEVRNVPLYIFPSNQQGKGDTRQTVSQLVLAPTVLTLMGVPIPDTMKHLPLTDFS